jgi:hypothetical protein
MGAIGSKDGLSSTDIMSFYTLITSLYDEVLLRKVSADNAKKIITHQLSVFDKYRLHQNRQTDASIFDEPNVIKIAGKYRNNDGKTAWVISIDFKPNSRSYKLLHGIPVSKDDSVRAGEHSQSLSTAGPIPQNAHSRGHSRGRSLGPDDAPPQRTPQDNPRSNSNSNLRNQQINGRNNMPRTQRAQHNRQPEQYNNQSYQNNYSSQQQNNYRRSASVDRFSYPNERQINMMSDMPNYTPRYDDMPYGQSNNQPYNQSYNQSYDPQGDVEEMPLGVQ